ncbi:MAG: hypothetical protein K0S23_1858 [Fluviicola sp.]|jgi:hypothetical protein|uniref:DUF1573 domain-containing protein n=1 Tax=Fluviicola sp. TaxID=1917219 RepID=UPI00260D8300|nr:DUF1573 domain-containing protein [Fluviicola sp.]MDF3027551.1 hypothetical protein [Fluviicola sp.]
MKTIILNIALTCGSVFGFSDLFAQEVAKGPQISIESETHNFGEIDYAGNGGHTFVVKNTGNEPLLIERVNPSCSCSVSDWTKEPVFPGETAKINIRYDTKRAGPFNKSFTLVSNAVNQPTMILKIKGTVLPAKEAVLESIPAVTN